MPKGPTNNDVNLNIRINNELMDALRAEAGLKKIKTSALIRDVLSDFLVVNNHKIEDLVSPRTVKNREVGTIVQKGGGFLD